MPSGQRSEVTAWHIATVDKPVPYLGAQPLWLPSVPHVVCEPLVSRTVFNSGPFKGDQV